jgi:hypothetical protein
VTSIGVRFTRASCSSATEVASSAIGSWRAARCGTPATTDGDAEPFGLTFRRCDGRGAVRTAPAGAGAGAVGCCAAAGRRGGASASPSHDESVMWMSRWTSPSQSLPIDATKRGHRTTHLGMRVDVRVRAPGGCAAGWRARRVCGSRLCAASAASTASSDSVAPLVVAAAALCPASRAAAGAAGSRTSESYTLHESGAAPAHACVR